MLFPQWERLKQLARASDDMAPDDTAAIEAAVAELESLRDLVQLQGGRLRAIEATIPDLDERLFQRRMAQQHEGSE